MNEADVDKVHAQVLDLVRERKCEDALRICRESLELWDECFHHDAWDQLAYVLWSCGQKDEAIEAISKAIVMAPEDRGHRFSRARFALGMGDLTLAKADWTKLVDLERALASEAFVGAALLGRALANAGLGDTQAALNDLSQIGDDEIMLVNKRLWTAGELRNELRRKAQAN